VEAGSPTEAPRSVTTWNRLEGVMAPARANPEVGEMPEGATGAQAEAAVDGERYSGG